MKNIVRLLFVALLIAGATTSAKAEMYVGQKDGGHRALKQTTAGCSPSSAFEWLNINNVRTRINAGGDMWWDLPSGTGSKYYVPANGSATSLFAGSLWIAGVDVNNQLKCAAVRFRQDGNDFWTGPLTITGASIDDVTCAQWDRIFKITRAEVDEFLLHFDGNGINQEDGYVIPNSILEWPAHPDDFGTAGVSQFLAPFYDQNGNGRYEPSLGDYPYYDIDNVLCHTKTPTMEEEYDGTVHGSILADQVLKGDQTLWWVFNDKGNAHTESDGSPIGIEVRGQAFGFATNDEINNMTFCSYEIINRSTYILKGTYFCPWTDVDLGHGWDDYVGCDVQRGLGYGYNGNAVDGNGEPEAYGDQPPAVGVDFFQGPYMDPDFLDNPKYSFTVNVSYVIDPVTHDTTAVVYDTINKVQLCDESINGVNFGNGIVDDERFGMRRFLYHNNTGDHLGDPRNAAETYNLLRGYWKDGNRMQYGGNAYPGAEGTVGPDCDFMFPGDTDPCNWGTAGIPPGDGFNLNGKYWTEETAGNQPNDRRFMQSAGPFTLQPGAVNYITFGVPWARATSGGPFASVELLRVTDDKCQALFDNCFKVIDGPNAPDLSIRELDQKLIIYLSNSPISNNYKEGYEEIDPEIPELRPDDSTGAMYSDRYYRFEGYKVYQLVNGEVGADELNDNNKARLVFQCDVKNTVTRLVNYEFDNSIGANVPSLKVDGGDAGITHSFVVTEDKFSTTENTALVNHKTYYFMAVAYAYNNFFPYSQEPGIINGLYGQMKPYLEGRKNIACYSAVPHKIVNGTVLNCEYGDKPSITRLVGQGNGGNELELTQESIDELFNGKKLANSYDENGKKVVFGHPDYPIIYHPTYKVGYGPLDVKIVDPLNVKTTDYELWFDTLFSVYSHGVTTNQSVIGDSAERMASHWFLKDLNSDEPAVMSDTTTVYTNEQMFVDRGISVSITQQYPVGPVLVGSILDNNTWKPTKEVVTPRSGLIVSSLTFQDSTNRWMDGIRDKDIPGSVLNWIRSGTYIDQDDRANADFNMTINTPYDPGEHFEKIANRTWAPFNLCSFEKQGFSTNPGPVAVGLARSPQYYPRIASVDIVLTADRSKWTRCPVIEMCMDNSLSEGNAKRFFLRRHASVDKDGNPTSVDWKTHPDQGSDDPEAANYIAAQGMGWFPGYAIDVESGARLNIIFGEDSYCEDLNGRDMQFNPPALLKATIEEMYGDYSQNYDPSIFRQIDGDPVMGGKHFVYIMGMDKPTGIESEFDHIDFNSPAYDGGAHSYHVLRELEEIASGYQNTVKEYFWRSCMYVGMPMAVEGTQWLAPGNDAKVRIRVSKPYDKGYYNGVELDSVPADLDINNMYPKYRFSIEGLNPSYNDPVKTESDLDLITVVPNPYYAYSTYEKNALNNKVKITNLPNNCVVTIYNIAGTKIRQFRKDNEEPSLDWDLTNFANTPVASGFYLIHVKDNVSGGERTIKFFGAMRQIDLNTF